MPKFRILKSQTEFRFKTFLQNDAINICDSVDGVLMVSKHAEKVKEFQQWRTDGVFFEFAKHHLMAAAIQQQDTLFVLISDECHYGMNMNGMLDGYINDPELVELKNLLVVQVSATPYALLTAQSR